MTPWGSGRTAILAVLLASAAWPAEGHEGPPYPILSDRIAGPYSVSVWTDPDTTDDGSAGGQFWTILAAAERQDLPAGTRVLVTIQPSDGSGPELTAHADPDADDPSRWFAALPMTREGRFRVRVAVDGPLGPAAVESEVEATYDARPAPALLAVYAVPFLLAGFLWLKLIVRRRAHARRSSAP